jgi:hypothetical protein
MQCGGHHAYQAVAPTQHRRLSGYRGVLHPRARSFPVSIWHHKRCGLACYRPVLRRSARGVCRPAMAGAAAERQPFPPCNRDLLFRRGLDRLRGAAAGSAAGDNELHGMGIGRAEPCVRNRLWLWSAAEACGIT